MNNRCPQPSKQRYSNEREARDAIIDISSRRGSPFRAYECSCGAWHLTKRLDPASLHQLIWRAKPMAGGSMRGSDGETVGYMLRGAYILDDAWLAYHGYRTKNQKAFLLSEPLRFRLVERTGEVEAMPALSKARERKLARSAARRLDATMDS